jgi:8-hydroxy-5-deazaflavin:NADPH oxidoreductase
VKAFNTTFATPLTAGEVAGHKLDVLIAGDDANAKGKVAALARDGGRNSIDVARLKRARELEAAGLLHIVVQNELGTRFASALKIVA